MAEVTQLITAIARFPGDAHGYEVDLPPNWQNALTTGHPWWVKGRRGNSTVWVNMAAAHAVEYTGSWLNPDA